MTDEPQELAPAPSSPEEQIASSQDVIQGLLETLGETWSEIERLKQENAALWQRISNAGLADELQAVKPGAPASPAGAPLRPAEQAVPMDEAPGSGVLIIDDSKLVQLSLRHCVEALGYMVVGTADDGESGVKQLKALVPRLVILDYHMPGMDGLECLRQIRQLRPNVKVVVCSAELTSQVSRALIYAGVNEIITKPVQLKNFTRVVKKWMGDE